MEPVAIILGFILLVLLMRSTRGGNAMAMILFLIALMLIFGT
jgi:hypothetical protein